MVAKSERIMKILVPSDFSKLSRVAARYASKLAMKLNAELLLLHVVYLDASTHAQVAMRTSKILDAMANADMLAMFIHKPTFLQKLFGKSVTREMAFHSWIPLLSIHRDVPAFNDISIG